MLAASRFVLPVSLLLAAAPAVGEDPDAAGPHRLVAVEVADVEDLRFAPGARCFAVLTREAVRVRDLSGLVLWERTLRGISPWIAPPEAVAVSPDCRTLVVAGNTGYRHVWFLRRDGARTHARVVGTPVSLAVSRGGSRVAVGTGAGVVALFTARGRELWSRDLGEQTCCVQGLTFAGRDRYLVLTRGQTGLMTAGGDLLWLVLGSEMQATPSLRPGLPYCRARGSRCGDGVLRPRQGRNSARRAAAAG